MWVWTGRDGDDADLDDTDLFRLDIEPSEEAQGATKARISTAFRGSKARFGDTVTITVQLQNSQGDDVRFGEDGERPAEWDLIEEVLIEAQDDVDGDTDGTGESLWTRSQPITEPSDSSGRITFPLRFTDPNRGSTGDSRTLTFRLIPVTNAPGTFDADENLKMSSGRSDGDRYFLEFSDADPVLADSVVTLTTSNRYINAPSGDSARKHRDRLRPQRIRRASLGGHAHPQQRQVRHHHPILYLPFGAAYAASPTAMRASVSEIETLTATVDPDGSTSTIAATIEKKDYVFWPDLAEHFDSNDEYTILFGDLDRDEIIVDTNNTDGQ